MAEYAEIKRKLIELTGGDINQPIQCEVAKVDGSSCIVVLEDGMELTDVRLRATLKEGDDELLITPKEGSKALVWSVDGTLNDLVLIKCDEVEKIEYKQGDLEVMIDSESKKVKVKNGQTSFKELFEVLYDFLENIKLSTPSGPTANVIYPTPPQLSQFKSDFTSLLED